MGTPPLGNCSIATSGQPAVEERAAVEIRRGRRGEGHDVARPAEALVPLGAVGGDGQEVVALRPDDVRVQPIDELVGAGELADAAQVAGHDDDHHVVNGHLIGRLDLGLAESVEGELGPELDHAAG
jgi:hypothetical protein